MEINYNQLADKKNEIQSVYENNKREEKEIESQLKDIRAELESSNKELEKIEMITSLIQRKYLMQQKDLMTLKISWKKKIRLLKVYILNTHRLHRRASLRRKALNVFSGKLID